MKFILYLPLKLLVPVLLFQVNSLIMFVQVNLSVLQRLQHMRHAITHACLCTCLKHWRWAKKACLVWFKKFQEVWQTPRQKQHCFLSLTFYKTQRSYKKFMCVYFLFYWFSGENCMFLFSLHKGRQTSKELKRNMNDGTTVFLMSLLIILTWKILFLFSFWYKIISCFK